MSDVMTGRERIVVGPGETLEGVFARLRASGARELILEVDARSPLLIGLQQLHSLDEVAQERGLQVAIASTNSKLLNAARVFGMEVIDARDLEPVALPEGGGQLLAGQPLDRRAPGAGVAIGDAPVEQPRFGRIDLTPRDPAPPMPPVEGEADRELPRARRGGEFAPAPRVDPYGQAFTDDAEEEADTAPANATRRIRPLRPARERQEAAAPRPSDDDGWEDGADGFDPERADAYPTARGRRGGLFAGLTAFWDDVRDWVDARRAPRHDRAEYADDDIDPAEEPEADEGWDEPPYRAHQGHAPTAPVEDEAEDVPEEEDTTPAPARVVSSGVAARPVPIGRASAPPNRAEDEEDAAPTAHLRPFIASVRTFDDEDDFEQEFAAPAERPRAGGRRRFAVGGLVGVLLALALVALLVAYVVIPTATVTLVARTGALPVEFSVVVGEIDPNSPEGQPTAERIVVPAKRIVVPLNGSSSKAATGARLEPDVTAGGPVVLTNPSTEAVTVPSGTTLDGTDGRTYVTLEAITIGPADPFDAGAFGSATVKVAATLRGSGGNAPIGAVRGRLASGVYYTNRSALIAGGSDRRIPTIARQDLAAAQAAAEEAARGKAGAALAGAIPAGGQVMHDTTGVGNYKVTFNTKEGTDGDSVTATVTAEVTALVYTPADVESRARAEAERRIGAAAKPGEPIVPGSIQIAAPQLAADVPGQLTYKVTGTARTRAAIGGDAERERLANALARQDDDAARDTLAQIPGVSGAQVEYHSGPFPQRMPWLASHITVRIAENP